MVEKVNLHWEVSRVIGGTLDLLEDEERRCLDLSILQCSILRQMVFPWARFRTRLVNEHVDYQTIVEMPEAYLDELDELEELLSGAYDGPTEGCPVSEIFVDRGDLPGYDFAIANLTADGAWHNLALVNVIGDALATRVLLRCQFTASAAAAVVRFREDGNTAIINIAGSRVHVTTVSPEFECTVVLPGTQIIEYYLSTTVTMCNIVVRGYWIPA